MVQSAVCYLQSLRLTVTARHRFRVGGFVSDVNGFVSDVNGFVSDVNGFVSDVNGFVSDR
eukprot:scaffold12380_cov88-Skeletonema_dohrnii-CCMP3373.AAC.2